MRKALIRMFIMLILGIPHTSGADDHLDVKGGFFKREAASGFFGESGRGRLAPSRAERQQVRFPSLAANSIGPQLSLISSMESQSELRQQLKLLRELERNRGVNVGRVVLVGFEASQVAGIGKALDQHAVSIPSSIEEFKNFHQKIKNMRRSRSRSSRDAASQLPVSDIKKEIFKLRKLIPAQQLLADYKLREGKVISSKRLINRYAVESSPVWIVKKDGIEHVFEGEHAVHRIFNARGEFLLASEGAAVSPGIRKHSIKPSKVHFPAEENLRNETEFYP